MSAATATRMNCEPSLDVVPFEVARHENAIDHHPIDDIEPEASTGLDLGGGALEVCRLAVAMGADRFILLAARVCNPRASVRELGRIAGVGHSTTQRRVDSIIADYPQLQRLFTSGKHNEGQRERRKNESVRDNSTIGEGAMMPEVFNLIGDQKMTVADMQRNDVAAKVTELQKLGLPIRKQRDDESFADYSQYVYGAEAEAVLGGRIEPVMASGKIKMKLAPRAQASKPVTPKPAPRNDRESIINSKRTIEGRIVRTEAGPAPAHATIGGADIRAFQKITATEDSPAPSENSITPHIDTYNAIKDPRVRTVYWNQHRDSIRAEMLLAGAAKAELGERLADRKRQIEAKQAQIDNAKREAARREADRKVHALQKTLATASKATLSELKTALAGMGV